jgi:hypothetical protein
MTLQNLAVVILVLLSLVEPMVLVCAVCSSRRRTRVLKALQGQRRLDNHGQLD